MEFQEGQIVLCTVDKVVGTSVFVKIEGDGEGTIVTSEIAPGRIRNLRDYVVPGKKIVCKILSIRGRNLSLSLRRVKQSERKELLEKIAKEQSYKAIIKTISKDTDTIIGEINKNYSLTDFFEKAKSEPKLLETYFTKQDSEKILKILESKKEKPKEIKQKIKLSSNSSNGINLVKGIINTACKNSKCDVSYIAAGKYSLGIIGEDFRKMKTEINSVLESIEKQAKKEDCDFEIQKE